MPRLYRNYGSGKVKNKIVSLLLLTALLLSLAVFPAGAEEDQVSVKARVSESGAYVELECTLTEALAASGDEKLCVFAIPPEGMAGGLEERYLVKSDIAVRKDFTVQLPRGTDVNFAFVLAAETDEGQYKAIHDPVYVSNPHLLAQRSYERPGSFTKKGLNVAMIADAQLLGIGHTVIEFPLNEYLATSQDNAVAFKWEKNTYFIKADKLNLLDHKIGVYTEAGVRVYINIVLTEKGDDLPASFECLYCEGAGDGAAYYGINGNSSAALEYLEAAVGFLTDRYTNEDGKYGFAADFIIGKNVNGNRNDNSVGPLTLAEYVKLYERVYRRADFAARSVYSGARLFVPVSGNFTVASANGERDPLLDYSSKDFIDAFSQSVKNGGDLPWGLSVSPYNADRGDADFWSKDIQAQDVTAKYITMDNIGVLTTYLCSSAFLYEGQRRTVIIGDIAFSGGTGSDADQKKQAAAFALAYFRAEANAMIDAIIWSHHVDSSYYDEDFGLWTRESGTNSTPGEKKLIYNTFKYIDTESSRAVCEMLLPVVGASSWGEAVSGYNPTTQEKRVIFTAVSRPLEGLSGKIVPLVDFSKGTEGFYPSDNAYSVAVSEEGKSYVLNAVMYDTYPAEYRGIARPVGKDELKDTGYITLTVTANSAGAGAVADLCLRLTGYTEDGKLAVYEGTSTLEADREYSLAFDVYDYVNSVAEIDHIRIWVAPHGEGTESVSGFTVSSLGRIKGASSGGGSVLSALGIIALCVVIPAAIVFLALVAKANLGSSKKRRRRR